MSSLSYADDKCIDWGQSKALKKIKNFLQGFFGKADVVRHPRIWHGNFSYPLVPETSIRSLDNMSPATTIDAGDCYVCIFEGKQYQGDYRIICPGEKVRVGSCNSLLISTQKISVNSARQDAKAPAGFWEMDGSMYIMRFSFSYRYV